MPPALPSVLPSSSRTGWIAGRARRDPEFATHDRVVSFLGPIDGLPRGPNADGSVRGVSGSLRVVRVGQARLLPVPAQLTLRPKDLVERRRVYGDLL